MHKDMYKPQHDIPLSKEMKSTKFEGVVVTSDTWNSAQLASTIVVEDIEAEIEWMTLLADNNYVPSIMRVDC